MTIEETSPRLSLKSNSNSVPDPDPKLFGLQDPDQKSGSSPFITQNYEYHNMFLKWKKMRKFIMITYTILETFKNILKFQTVQPSCIFILSKINNFFSSSLVLRRIRILI